MLLATEAVIGVVVGGSILAVIIVILVVKFSHPSNKVYNEQKLDRIDAVAEYNNQWKLARQETDRDADYFAKKDIQHRSHKMERLDSQNKPNMDNMEKRYGSRRETEREMITQTDDY